MGSNFTTGLTSFGVPIFGNHPMLLRAAQLNAKVYFVDPRSNATSDRHEGTDPGNPLSTVTQAEDRLVDESGDCVVYLGADGGTASSSRDTGTITWDKSGCSLIAGCTWVPWSQRSRMAPSTSFAGALMAVTGHNNWFSGFQMFQGHDAASTCLSVAGQRNRFDNMHIAGIGHATAGDDAASESLLINGGSENLFTNCTIGLSTIARSAATAEIRVTTAATRNKFVNCAIECYADAATPYFFDVPDSAGIDRELTFEDCPMKNYIDSASTVMTVAANIHATCGGTVFLIGKTFRQGATDWAASFVNLAQLMFNSGTAATDMGAPINGS